MKTDFRALCAELADAYLRTLEHINNSTWLGYEPSDDPLLQRARAALADEPAAPTPPADGEVAELVAWLQEEADDYECIGCEDSVARCTRAAELLQRQAPVQPADGEVAGLVAKLRRLAPQNPLGTADPTITRAADLLERQALVPVPISERLPGPEDCDAEGRCWWGRAESDDWSADWTLATPEAIAEFCEFSPQTVWLPAHALPLPEVNV